jgi:cell wall-associated NlpC family hydrolase
VTIPRTTYEQVAALPAIPKASLQPGDILFFNGDGHESMYVGNGMMIDAPRTGEVIRLLPVDSDWYAQTYESSARP